MAIEYVNGAQNFDLTSGSTIAAPATNHTSGNLLVVFTVCYSADATEIVSITDTAGNTYTKINGTPDTVPLLYVEMWYAKNVIGNASNVVTVTYDGSYWVRGIQVLQYAGCDTVDPLDQTAIGKGSTGTTGITADVTTTFADEVLVAGDGIYNNVTHTAGTGYTIRTSLGGSEPSYGSTEDMIVEEIGTYNASFSYSSNTPWAIVMASFKAAEAPAPGRSWGAVF